MVGFQRWEVKIGKIGFWQNLSERLRETLREREREREVVVANLFLIRCSFFLYDLGAGPVLGILFSFSFWVNWSPCVLEADFESLLGVIYTH